MYRRTHIFKNTHRHTHTHTTRARAHTHTYRLYITSFVRILATGLIYYTIITLYEREICNNTNFLPATLSFLGIHFIRGMRRCNDVISYGNERVEKFSFCTMIRHSLYASMLVHFASVYLYSL